jgi:hypothetical protein
MLRISLALLMALHGLAHVPGVVGSWRLAPLEAIPPHTTVLAGRLDVGEGGMRILGAAWLLAAALFWLSSAGASAGRVWWLPVAVGAATLSLVLTVLELPYARVGLVVNVAILAVLAVARGAGWLAATP